MSESIIEGTDDMDVPRAGIAIPAAVAAGMGAALAAWGTFGDSDPKTGEYLAILAIIAVATAVVFGWIVPRGLHRGSAAATALVLSVLGVVSIAAFWSGVPPVLAMGGIVLGWAGRDARNMGMSRAALAVGLLALVADVAVYVQDRLL